MNELLVVSWMVVLSPLHAPWGVCRMKIAVTQLNLFQKHLHVLQYAIFPLCLLLIIIIIIIIMCYIYIALFWVLKALYIVRRVSPHPPPVCSIHLDDATAAILRQNAHHTPAYWWRGDRVMKPISVWGWLGGHDGGRRPIGKFGQGYTPTLFQGHPGIFNDHRESGTLFNVLSEGWFFL